MAQTPAIDDMDDIYGTPSANNTPAVNFQSASDYMAAKQPSTAQSHQAGIPGLGMIASPPPASADVHIPDAVAEPSAPVAVEPQISTTAAQENTHTSPSTSEAQVTATDDIEISEPLTTSAAQDTTDNPQSAPQDGAVTSPDVLGNTDAMNETLPSSSKPPVDPEFLEAAKALKGEQGAEWQYDSSDAESSSDDSSDDSSSDEDDSDDEGYELLDPATAARMLMEEGGMDDDDGPGKGSAQSQLRTKNEQPEQIIPKPEVTVTPDMKVTPLGLVQHVVENLILIRAFTSGEYQVLESGSVLCLENREVIGAVQDTLGKVEEPLYSVAFTKPSDITDLNISEDTQVFYVDTHSTFVFTEPLKNLKGTDASNLHDEELAEEEMEFSDDEAEAAYKRAKKQAKKGARAQQDQPQPPQPSARPYTGGAMNYDDEPEGEDMYTPLARPDNLQEILAGGAPSLPPRRQFNERGRGRGRGRGDRGRGDRGRGGRGGRGVADISNQRKGPANSYPDSHNSQTPTNTQQQLPQRPVVPPQMWSQNQPQMNVPFAFPQFGQQQFPPPPPLPQTQPSFPNLPFAWSNQTPNPQQFFMNPQQQQPFQYPTAPPTPGGSIPAGAFVNPAFFQTMQQQQQQQQQQQVPPAPAATPQNSGPSPEAIQAAQDLWRRLANQPQQ